LEPRWKYLASTEYSSTGILTVWENWQWTPTIWREKPANGDRAGGHAFSPDGKSQSPLVSFSETLNVFEISDGRIIRQINQVAVWVVLANLKLAALCETSKGRIQRDQDLGYTSTWQLLFTAPVTRREILHFACSPRTGTLGHAPVADAVRFRFDIISER